MRRFITIYDPADGLILSSSITEEGDEPEDVKWIEGRHDAGVSRIDLATLNPVPLYTFSFNIETNRIGNIPHKTEFVIGGEKHTINTGFIALVVDEIEALPFIAQRRLYVTYFGEVNCDPASN